MSVITFKPNDHTKITTDFERHEFACPCGCTAQMIDPELVQKMQTIRTKLGKAIKVTSGYRCVKHNADPKVGAAGRAATSTALRPTGARRTGA